MLAAELPSILLLPFTSFNNVFCLTVLLRRRITTSITCINDLTFISLTSESSCFRWKVSVSLRQNGWQCYLFWCIVTHFYSFEARYQPLSTNICCVCVQRMLWLDYDDAQANINLSWLPMCELPKSKTEKN